MRQIIDTIARRREQEQWQQAKLVEWQTKNTCLFIAATLNYDRDKYNENPMAKAALDLSLTGEGEEQAAADGKAALGPDSAVRVGEAAPSGTERIEMVGVRIGVSDPEQEEAAAERNKGAAEVLMRGHQDVAEIFRPPGR